jgi:hypothetical protein
METDAENIPPTLKKKRARGANFDFKDMQALARIFAERDRGQHQLGKILIMKNQC